MEYVEDDIYAYIVGEFLTSDNPGEPGTQQGGQQQQRAGAAATAGRKTKLRKARILGVGVLTLVVQLALLLLAIQGAPVAEQSSTWTVAKANETLSKSASVHDLPKNAPSTIQLRNRDYAVAFAVLTVIILVHCELVRAAVLARITLSHAGLMHPFFAPLYIQGVGGVNSVSGLTKVLMLCMPLPQYAVCFMAWMGATLSFAKDAQEGQVLTIILNSVALLFVLELDNVVCTFVKESNALTEINASQHSGLHRTREIVLVGRLDHNRLGINPDVQTSCERYLGLLYAGLISGGLWLLMPFWSFQLITTSFFGSEYTLTCSSDVGLRLFKTNPEAAVAMAALYCAFALFCFEPPLLPADNSSCWRAWHKAFVVANAVFTCSVFVANAYCATVLSYRFQQAINGVVVFEPMCLYMSWPWVISDAKSNVRFSQAPGSLPQPSTPGDPAGPSAEAQGAA